MQANHAATLKACPPLFFFPQELFGTQRFDLNAVFDQTDLISSSVARVDLFRMHAGKRCALVTKIEPAAESAAS